MFFKNFHLYIYCFIYRYSIIVLSREKIIVS